MAANLTEAQSETIAASAIVHRVEANRSLLVAAKKKKDKKNKVEDVSLTVEDSAKSDVLDFTGRGVTIAVLDTGLRSWNEFRKDSTGGSRLLAQYDAIDDREISSKSKSDDSGHGTHVSAIAVSGDTSTHPGVAPDAGLVREPMPTSSAGSIGSSPTGTASASGW